MNADGKFVGLIRGWLCTLPHDLKVACEAMDDENLSREQRELAVGAIIYVVSPNDVIGDRNDAAVSFTDDALLLRLALREIVSTAGEDAALLRARFDEQFAGLDEELKICEQGMGDLYGWLAAKVEGLRKLDYKGKKLKVYLDNDEARESLFEDVLVFRTDYPVDEDTIGDKLKKATTITDVMKRRRADEQRLGA